LNASYDHGFALRTIRIAHTNDRITVWTHTHFKDNSGRPDMDIRDTMKKA
jgi:hypothetical protein